MFRQRTRKERYSGQTYVPARKEQFRRNSAFYYSPEKQKQWDRDRIHDLIFSLLSLLIPGSISSFGLAAYLTIYYFNGNNVYVYLFWTIFILLIIYASFLFLFLIGGNPKRESSKTFKYLFNIVIYIFALLLGGFASFVVLAGFLAFFFIRYPSYAFHAFAVFIVGLLLILSWIFSVIALCRYAGEDLRGERQYTDTRRFGYSGTREVLPEKRQSNRFPIHSGWKLLALAGIILIIGSSMLVYFSVHAYLYDLKTSYPSYLPGHGTIALYNSHLYDDLNTNIFPVPVNKICTVTNDTYNFKNPSTFKDGCAILALAYDNYALEAQMRIVKGDCGHIFIFFNIFSDEPTFNFCQDGTYQIGYTDITTPFQSFRVSTAIYHGHDQSNLIAIVKRGNTFSTYINKQLISSVTDTDTNYKDGTICLGALEGKSLHGYRQSDVEVEYKEVKVWTL